MSVKYLDHEMRTKRFDELEDGDTVMHAGEPCIVCSPMNYSSHILVSISGEVYSTFKDSHMLEVASFEMKRIYDK